MPAVWMAVAAVMAAAAAVAAVDARQRGWLLTPEFVIDMATALPHRLPPRFVSVTIDIGNINKSGVPVFGLLTNNSARKVLARGLAPAFVRVGGTSGDFTYYRVAAQSPDPNPLCEYAADTDHAPASWSLGTRSASSPAECCDECASMRGCVVATLFGGTCYLKAASDAAGGAYRKPGVTSCALPAWATTASSRTLERYQLDGLRAYAAEVGWSVIFGFNAQFGYNRSAGHRWDPTNAEALAAYASSSAGPPISAWELGNELDVKGHAKNFTPAMVAQDFATFAASNVSSTNGLGGGSRSPLLFGSDPTNSGVYLPCKNPKWCRLGHSYWFQEFVGNLTERKVWLDGVTCVMNLISRMPPSLGTKLYVWEAGWGLGWGTLH